jgi:hypothetical protein
MPFISQFLHLRKGRYFILSDSNKFGIQMPIIIIFSNYTLVIQILKFKFLLINIGSLFDGLPKL